MAHQGLLPPVHRYITAHDSSGKAIFSSTVDETLPFTALPDNHAAFGLGYITKGFPVDLNSDADIQTYQPFLVNPPGLSASNGSVLRFVDFCPGCDGPMHRTVSIDYGVVLEGEMECVLDSGETRAMKRGDVCIQRGTNHAWKNRSDKEWARMMFVLLPAKPLEVAGTKLAEDINTTSGIPASD